MRKHQIRADTDTESCRMYRITRRRFCFLGGFFVFRLIRPTDKKKGLSVRGGFEVNAGDFLLCNSSPSNPKYNE